MKITNMLARRLRSTRALYCSLMLVGAVLLASPAHAENYEQVDGSATASIGLNGFTLRKQGGTSTYDYDSSTGELTDKDSGEVVGELESTNEGFVLYFNGPNGTRQNHGDFVKVKEDDSDDEEEGVEEGEQIAPGL